MPILDKSNKDLIKKYEEFVETSSYGKYMQSMNWANVKNNWESDYVYIEENDDIIAAISILSVKNSDGYSFSYASRGPVCDFNDIDMVKRLIEESKPVLEKHNSFLLRMDPEVIFDKEILKRYHSEGLNLVTYEDPHAKEFSNPPYNVIFRFVRDGELMSEEDIITKFNSSTRNCVRKSYRNGVHTEFLTKDDPRFVEYLDGFYELIETTSNRQDIAYRPKEYFQRLFDNYDDVKLFRALTEDNQLASSSIIVSFNNKSYYLYAGNNFDFKNLYSGYQIIYESMLYAYRNGYEEYDFGGIYGIDNSDHLYNFKTNFARDEGHTRYIGDLDIVINEEQYKKFLG